MRRLKNLLGKETVASKRGCTLRLFIRESRDAVDSEDTAVAMKKAIIEAVAAQLEGRIKRSVYGYLVGQAFYWARQLGWRFDAANKCWVKGKSFSMWEVLQSLKKSIRRSAAAAWTFART